MCSGFRVWSLRWNPMFSICLCVCARRLATRALSAILLQPTHRSDMIVLYPNDLCERWPRKCISDSKSGIRSHRFSSSLACYKIMFRKGIILTSFAEYFQVVPAYDNRRQPGVANTAAFCAKHVDEACMTKVPRA